MRVMKWLFHPVYLLAVIVAIVLFLNRGVLFAEPSQSGEVEVLIEKVDGVIESLQSGSAKSNTAEANRIDTQQMQTTPRQKDPIPAKQQDRPATVTTSNQQSSDKDVASAEEGTSNASQQVPEQVEPRITENAVGGVAHNELQTADETWAKGVTAIPDSGSPVTPGTGESTILEETTKRIRQTWQQARIAAWQGDHKTAILHYQTVVTLQPDNFDAYGEMGNIMLLTGDRDGAAEAYYQAARLISKTPYRMVAWNLLSAIAWLDPQKADKLYQELTRP